MATQDIIVVGVSTSTDDVLKYDSEGKKLRFDEENFLELTKEEVEKLSTRNKREYYTAYGMWVLDNDPVHGEIEDEVLVSPESKRLQNTNMLDVTVKPGLKAYHANVQQIEKLKREGFRMAKDSDLADDNTGSRHIKIGGYTDNILMVRDEEVAEKFKAEKRKRNKMLRTGQSAGETKENLEKLGQKLDLEEYEVKKELA